jgi:NAD(P)-dependent dehydrogenase (short-subunit alcohol dehydrogenase family)
VVVITGVGRGLGAALVERFVAAGWLTVGCSRNADHVAALARRHPAPHQFSRCDVAQAAEVAAWGRDVLATCGPPDLLLNNAAVINRNAPLWEVPAAEFAHVVNVNLNGVHHVLQQFVPAMAARRRGVIVNFSSGWGRSTAPEVAPYCATKWGIEGLTQALAQELPHGMAAVALNPGIINTDMLRSCFAGAAGQFPTPEEWSEYAAPFLMGLAAKDNGRSLDVPGVPT